MSTASPSPQSESRPRLVVLTTEITPPPSGAARFEEQAEVTWTDAEGLPQAIVGAQILLDLGVRDMIVMSSTRPEPAALEGYGLNIVGWRGMDGEVSS